MLTGKKKRHPEHILPQQYSHIYFMVQKVQVDPWIARYVAIFTSQLRKEMQRQWWLDSTMSQATEYPSEPSIWQMNSVCYGIHHFHLLVGGLEHVYYFHTLGMSSSPLTFMFFRGVGIPPTNMWQQRESRIYDHVPWLRWNVLNSKAILQDTGEEKSPYDSLGVLRAILHLVPSGNQTWLENPRTEWRFLANKITYFNGPFSSQPCLITGG